MNDHISAIMNVVDAGVDVRGYYAWSTFDLYSWKNGVEKRYGLVGIDFDDKDIYQKEYDKIYNKLINEMGV